MIDNKEEATFEVLKHDLSRFLPIRIVLRKGDTGELEGLCEESFSMNLSNTHVRIWWSGKAYSLLGEHIINGEEDAQHNASPGDLIINPLSADCPIDINWDIWKKATNKYGKRNAPFTLKKNI